MILGFLSGMKEEMITPIILIGVPYIFSGNKLSKAGIYPYVGFEKPVDSRTGHVE